MELDFLREFVKDARDFQLEVLETLAGVKAEMAAVSGRLDTLNGSVARHEKDLGELKIAGATTEAVGKAKTVAAEKLRGWLQPFLVILASALISLAVSGWAHRQ